ncbi:ADP-heptose--LPS heptosyltransferase [Dictyobacter alpinus]|uniref:lipopolysaccharide heptosyltransferase II n=2 Tax=Dictyobacter alpinus TaxID=2014873 RepID=A0A402B8R2_9CHLR|nr:ADP-heptose--LPS heptosyltransferase [Dictyobacter alpinus]
MTTPLLEVLRQNYPQAQITYITGTWSKAIAEHHPAVDTIIDCGTIGIPGRYTLKEYGQLARQLRGQHFDLAFVLDRSPLLTLLPWLAGVPRRVGPDSLGRGFSLTDRVPVSVDPTHLEHQAEIYLDLARAIGLTIEQPAMRFVPTEQERQSIYRSDYPQVVVFPGGGSNPGMDLTAKRWPLDRYRALTRRIVSELKMQVLLIGGESDRELNQTLIDGLEEVPPEMVVNLAGKTSFGQSAAQIEASTLFIGNDSSPMHLAAAVGTPVIAIFGPTSPAEYGPYPLSDPQHIALWRHPTGQPCFFLGKMQACDNCTCMHSVTIDDVWDAVMQLLPQIRQEEVQR